MLARIIGKVGIVVSIFIYLCLGTSADEHSAFAVKIDELVRKIDLSLEEKAGGKIQRIAIIEFVDVTGKSRELDIGAAISESITGEFVRLGKYQVIERRNLNKVLEELKLGLSGIIDSSSAKEVGKILGADALVQGSVTEVGRFYSVNTRVVEVETSRIISAEIVEIEQEGVLSISSKYVITRKYPITAGFMSTALPGWGQFYNDEPVKGSILLGTEALLLGGMVFFHFYGNDLMEDYRANTPESIVSYDQAATSYIIRDFLFLTYLGVWGYSVGDGIFGAINYKGERSDIPEQMAEGSDGEEGLPELSIDTFEKIQRSPLNAWLISIFPGIVLHGAGHSYANDEDSATLLLGLEGLSLGLIVYGLAAQDNTLSPITIIGGTGLFWGTWIWDMVGSPFAAQKYNRSVRENYRITDDVSLRLSPSANGAQLALVYQTKW